MTATIPAGGSTGSSTTTPRTEILRYDNAHEDAALGCHHRHVRFGDDTEIAFHGIVTHVTRFLTEIADLTDTENTPHE